MSRNEILQELNDVLALAARRIYAMNIGVYAEIPIGDEAHLIWSNEFGPWGLCARWPRRQEPDQQITQPLLSAPASVRVAAAVSLNMLVERLHVLQDEECATIAEAVRSARAFIEGAGA